MFEIIGLFIGTAFVLALSGVLGCVFALLSWLAIHKTHHRVRLVLTAALLPSIGVLYMGGCEIAFSIMLPGEAGLLFGDISEPLPNGYRLAALGKMPDYGRIEAMAGPAAEPQLTGWIGRVAVEGPLIFGAYDIHLVILPAER